MITKEKVKVLLDDKVFDTIKLILNNNNIDDIYKIKAIKNLIDDRNNLSINEFVDKYRS